MLQYGIFYIKCVLDVICMENVQTGFPCCFFMLLAVHADEFYNYNYLLRRYISPNSPVRLKKCKQVYCFLFKITIVRNRGFYGNVKKNVHISHF